jgi:hypothetical protein
MIDFETAKRIVAERLVKMERDMNDFGSVLPGHKDKPYLHLVVTITTEYEFGWRRFAPPSLAAHAQRWALCEVREHE